MKNKKFTYLPLPEEKKKYVRIPHILLQGCSEKILSSLYNA